jgi:Zn finger protein HypA/HybF involved in hydrogenase expression
MHEAALCEGVLAVALDAAGGDPVTRVRVRVGELQAVVPESFEFSWRLVAEGTDAAEAAVELNMVGGDILEVEEVEVEGGEVRRNPRFADPLPPPAVGSEKEG